MDAWHEEEEIVLILAVDAMVKEVEVYVFSHLVKNGHVMVCSSVVVNKVVSLDNSVIQVTLVQNKHNFRVVQGHQVVPGYQVSPIILQNLACLNKYG